MVDILHLRPRRTNGSHHRHRSAGRRFAFQKGVKAGMRVVEGRPAKADFVEGQKGVVPGLTLVNGQTVLDVRSIVYILSRG